MYQQQKQGVNGMKTMNYTLSDDIFITVENTARAGSFPAYHSHNAYEIYILTDGARNMYIGNNLYAVESGDAAMLKPDIPHRSYGTTPYCGICIEFSEKYLSDNLTFQQQRCILSCFENNIISLNSDSVQLLRQKAEDTISGVFAKKDYLLMLSEILTANIPDTNIESKRSFESDLSPIGVYIQENYTSIKSLDELCGHFGVSKSYLCRIFKKQTGITIIEYINRLKVQYAYKLLQETDLPVKEISLLSGFDTVIYFNRVFKKVMGDTPKNAQRIAKNNWTYIE